ncbi:solute carrier family 12 member [Elysia marginata]|uniref:Solute carrier family 12 member n=1 Tax=Elysia marginata TaxID=1093978 RepID=A0AAV4FLI5_9GAST|nr:solute carrier family 12 member [Elysia marginata]
MSSNRQAVASSSAPHQPVSFAEANQGTTMADRGRFAVIKISSEDLLDKRKSYPSSIFDEPLIDDGSKVTPLDLDDFKTTYEKVKQSNSLALFEAESNQIRDVLGKTVGTDDKDTDKNDQRKANLGTFFGVFLPCCQNIVGVIFFVRLPWIVGTAGIAEGAVIVFICNMMSVCTALSMSAIATNGRVTAGGTYFMISRSLGPSFGGSVGFLFFMGTSISVAMYYLGTVETLLKYIAPELAIFHKEPGDNQEFNDYRVYGTVLLMMMAFVVFIGVTCVSRFAFCAILFLVAALASVFVGLAVASPETSEKICVIGDRAMRFSLAHFNGSWNCHKNITGKLFHAYCLKKENFSLWDCDPYFDEHEARLIPAVPGFAISILRESWNSFYSEEGTIPGTEEEAVKARDIHNDIATSFILLIAIYFPSITGVESGSNYSGDLKDAQVSIPRGTISAVIVTSTIYLSSVFLFGGCVEGILLRDKYGKSISDHGYLVLSTMAWPSKWVVLAGTLTATIGAGLQALAGGPRLLQAIAEDNIIPNLQFFSQKWRGEPVRCLFFTFAIAELGILIAFLDYVAPIVTMFFLMCYGFINFAVTLQSLLDTPHWRPSFKYYHWSLTLFGTALCVTVMFICNWTYALLAIFLATCLHQYIGYKGAEIEWGDGITGLSMTVALYALSRIKGELKHIKNWRPQVLVLLKVDMTCMENDEFYGPDRDLVHFAQSLKMGKGLVMFGTCLKGDLEDHVNMKYKFKQYYERCLEKMGVHGFIEVIAHPSIQDGLCCMIQSAGLGALRPNTVLLGWPYDWIERKNMASFRVFLETMRSSALHGNAVIILKADEPFPTPKSARTTGTIDIWWIVHILFATVFS